METKTYQTIKVEKEDGITWVILNRPENRIQNDSIAREPDPEMVLLGNKKLSGNQNHQDCYNYCSHCFTLPSCMNSQKKEGVTNRLPQAWDTHYHCDFAPPLMAYPKIREIL